MGFLVTLPDATKILGRDGRSADVVKPYVTGQELLVGDGTPQRWLIDFQRRSQIEAGKYAAAFDLVQHTVLPQMLRIADKKKTTIVEPKDEFDKRIAKRALRSRLDTWWHLRRCVPETVAAIERLSRFIACSRVTKRPIFVFMSSNVRPAETVVSFSFEDDYSFGVLQSGRTWLWFVTKCGKLTERFRYSVENVFETFPWPQSPTKKQIEVVASAAVEVRRVRAEALKITTGGLRAVYRTLELPGKHPLKDAHAALDAAVLAAYGFDAKKDLLAQLLELNLKVSAIEKSGNKVTAPGVPPSYGDAKKLITDDCIKP